MGNSASKAARKYPTRASVPKLAPHQAPSHPEAKVQSNTLADSHRSEAIEQDAGDPDFLSNLSRLGQVRVDHHMQHVRPEVNNTTRLFASRAKSEAATEPAKNQLYASVLSDLLNRRKGAHSRQDLEMLAREFNIDVGKLEMLARFVNSPSINSASIRPVAGKSEEDGFMATAVWMEPKLRN